MFYVLNGSLLCFANLLFESIFLINHLKVYILSEGCQNEYCNFKDSQTERNNLYNYTLLIP